MLNTTKEVAAYLIDDQKAAELIEALRWPEGVVICPHCDHPKAYVTKGLNPARKQWKCADCRTKFSVTTGTIFEGSHIGLGKWIYAAHMMNRSKKGASAYQLKRELGITMKAAWFMFHRLRYAVGQEPVAGMLGKGGGIVELDETVVGGLEGNNKRARKRGSKVAKKTIVMTLIDREGPAKSIVVPNTKAYTLQKIAKPIVDKSATIMTDAAKGYSRLDEHFHAHHAVDHSKTFVRGVIIHTNFAESYHSLLKRAIIGTFHHVSDKHLPLYLNEFDWRWNTRKLTDGERTIEMIKRAPNRRLKYRKGKNAKSLL